MASHFDQRSDGFHSGSGNRRGRNRVPFDVNTAANPIVFTIGHSTRTCEEVVALLQAVDVTLLLDVRTIPRSRLHPQFNADSLAAALRAHDIGYKQLPALGGRRHHPKGAPPSLNTFWQVSAFRNYADYAETPAFRAGLEELVDHAREQRCVIMCAEAVWWRCHRRIIADYLLTRGVVVEHIIGPRKVTTAVLTPAAHVLSNGVLRYTPA